MYATNGATAVGPGHLPTCHCVECIDIRPTLKCPVTWPRGSVAVPLPVDFRKVGHEIWPPCWWGGQLQEVEVEEGWTGGHTEDEVSLISQSTMDDAAATEDRLPSIHTLGLWGLRRTSAMHHQLDPPDNIAPSPATTISSPWLETQELGGTAHHQLPSQSPKTNIVPEQDSPRDGQGESSRDNCKRESERIHSGGTGPLQICFIQFDSNGNSSTWIV